MKHPVTGEVKEVTEAEFLARFAESVRDRIKANAQQPGVEAVICLENLQMDSSQCGHRTALIVGPGCTYKLEDIEKLPNFRLGDVPSRFQYPTAFWRVSGVTPENGSVR